MQQQSKFYRSAVGYSFVFWSLVIVGIVFISFSHPMMKLRFDIWQHLGSIDDLVMNPGAKIAKSNWHATWAFLFRTIGVNDIFTYAVIIHRIQFLLNCIVIYYAAKLIFAALLPTIEFGNRKQWLSSLAISSVLVWLTVIGTVSTFQQAWIMWYSVNYQITLSLLFLALGLFVNAIAEAQTNNLKQIKLVGSLVLLAIVYLYHAAELVYLAIYIPIILLCFSNKSNYKKIAIIIVIGIVFVFVFVMSGYYTERVPELLKLLKNGNFSKIKSEINIQGLYNTQGGNRYLANWNELYALSIYMVVPVVVLSRLKSQLINRRVLYFIVLSLAFCFIPTFKYSAGLVSLISYNEIVNRYYFSSLVFILIPLFIYLVACHLKFLRNPIYLLATVLGCMGLVFYYSKLHNNGGVYYQNVKSIRDSLYADRVGIDMPASEIESIGRQIRAAENKYGSDKVRFCTSYDKAHVVWYIYRQKNMRFDRNGVTYGFFQCIDDARDTNKFVIIID